MKQDIRIYVAAFRPSPYPDDEGYVPLHVGKTASNHDLGLLGDDTGDNISIQNPNYCELTGLYWLWKNTTNKYVGLTHYRRFFAPKEHSTQFCGSQIAASSDFEELASDVDMIVATPAKFVNHITQTPISNEQQYSSCTIGIDLATTREAIELHDSRYLNYYDFVMRDNSCSLCNMFVAKKEVVDAYCAWLFPILKTLEHWIPYSTYNTTEARVFGFLGERLLNVWVARNRRNYKIAYRPIMFFDGI